MPSESVATTSQSRISTYFQSSPRKRTSSHVIDLTVDNADAEDMRTPSKRACLSKDASDLYGSSRNTSSRVASATKEWCFSPDKTKQQSATRPLTAVEKARREAFRKKLLQDNSSFLRKADTPKVDDRIVESEERSDHDDQFEKLAVIFAHKSQDTLKRKGKTVVRTKKVVDLGPSGEPYTPLEKQILKLKKDNPGTVLMVEVGYKYRFFGEDAKVAAKDLGMVAYNDRNFLVASIPIHRRDIHLKNLLSHGYRVGIVGQTETAALKKIGDNRNAPFDRKITHLYTAATFVDEIDSVDDLERYTAPPFVCIVEERKKPDASADVSIGMISICPSTGDIVWDDFDDGVMRIELETRLVHTRPSELLIPKSYLTEETNKMLSHFTGVSTYGHETRTEKFEHPLEYTSAFDMVSEFYTDKKKFGAASESFRSGELMASITDFPNRVVIALAQAIKYLSAFGIADAFLETKFFTKFTTRVHMQLAANTLSNLEIYRNETDKTSHGSLMWILDRTKTKFGARLLRSWVGRPLVDRHILQDRIDAVEEILQSPSERLVKLREVLRGLPDLAKGLCRIQYGQCTPKEISILLPAFNKVVIAFDDVNPSDPSSVGLSSSVLNAIISSLPRLKGPVKELLQIVNIKKAGEGKKDTMWNDPERYPGIIDSDMSLQAIELELADELKAIRKQLRMPLLQWTTVAIDDYLVEVKRSENRPIPDNWILHSKTKNLARYYTPAVRAKLDERAQCREMLEAEANNAFRSFLKDISQNYYSILRDAVNNLAAADCLLSLAQVALQDSYVRPEFTDDDTLEIVDGRHPMVEAYSNEPYVPNSVSMGGTDPICKIITGPNMGGKSSSVRMIALVVLMAQIGSYVPAAAVKMGLVDSILTRMGASDDLARGRSTFMVEMSETSEILQTATNRSLVILDELGRGTSTFDGMAIADATLQYLVENKKCRTMFITHYPLVATKLSKKFPLHVQNLHMSYDAEEGIDGIRRITFMYKLVPGIATESFGIECGRLAGVPEEVLSVATKKAGNMQDEIESRIQRKRLMKAAQQIQSCLSNKGLQAYAAVDDLKTTLELCRGSI